MHNKRAKKLSALLKKREKKLQEFSANIASKWYKTPSALSAPSFDDCDTVYVGQTSRALKTRTRELSKPPRALTGILNWPGMPKNWPQL